MTTTEEVSTVVGDGSSDVGSFVLVVEEVDGRGSESASETSTLWEVMKEGEVREMRMERRGTGGQLGEGDEADASTTTTRRRETTHAEEPEQHDLDGSKSDNSSDHDSSDTSSRERRALRGRSGPAETRKEE